MNLRLDARRFLASALSGDGGPDALKTADVGADADLRRLPWSDGEFSAIELDDVPQPAAWTCSGPALNECRRVLKRNGLLEIRTRRRDGRSAQEGDKESMAALTRLLQNHGFEVVSMDAVDDDGAMISALALRAEGPEDVFEDAMRTPATHVTLHGPFLDDGDGCASNRALAVSLDELGVKVRVRVIFDVVDALAFD